MEEKERYVIRYDLDYNRCLIDTEKNQGVGDYIQIVKLLNQQSKRIKELEKTNKILSNELTKNRILKQDCIETCCGIPIFEIPKMKEENQQLKQQLAEKKKEIADLQLQLQQANEIINNPDTLIFQQQQLIDNLEKTIEEKNKEISNLNGLVRERDKQIKNLKTNKKRAIEHKNKTKISFAVEQLEKVKDYFIEGYAVCKNFSDFYWNFTEQIDNQIKKLAHQHEDKGE